MSRNETMDPILLMFSALLLLCAYACFWMVREEAGSGRALIYAVLGFSEVVASIAIHFIRL